MTAFDAIDVLRAKRDGQPLMPCGRCRQLLWEHGGPDMLIETVSLGIVPMREVLPDAFGPDDLERAAGR